MTLTMLFIIVKADAGIHGTHGMGTAHIYCPPHANISSGGAIETEAIDAGVCDISSSAYVPASGYYTVITVVEWNGNLKRDYKTNPVYLDGSKTINEQDINLTGGVNDLITMNPNTGLWLCPVIVDSNGKRFLFPEYQTECDPSIPVLPFTPTVPDTSCTVNGGNALSVSLGTLNRDEIPTVPDSASAISKTISVVCTGGTVTANMQLNYTPISVGSNQAVKTSANGVGAAIFYSNKVLAPSDVTSVNFLEGSNTVTLGFQAVRDSTVALKDIPTGAFTANAVLVMTQQ